MTRVVSTGLSLRAGTGMQGLSLSRSKRSLARLRGVVAAAALSWIGVAGPPAAAAGDAHSVEAATDVAIEHRLGPREVREDCFDLVAAGRVEYAFEFVGEIRFNLHHHVGDETFYDVGPVQLSAADQVISLPDPGRYCLMYTNLGTEDASVQGRYRVLAP